MGTKSNLSLMEYFNYKANKAYTLLTEKTLKVYEIFKEFFEEEFVDLQGIPTKEEFLEDLKFFDTDAITGGCIKTANTNTWGIIAELSSKRLKQVADVLEESRVINRLSVNYKPFILVHFPHVTVTNENNRSIDITHLYAKVYISWQGEMQEETFYLNRSEYTAAQFRDGYMHSHICSIPKHDFTAFERPCLGEGPIRNTILKLECQYDEDIWKLFCVELDRYVRVESLAGRPYKYLEQVGKGRTYLAGGKLPIVFDCEFNVLKANEIKQFIKYFIKQKVLKFNFINGSFGLGMPLKEYLLLVSNHFITWYNEQYNNKVFNYNYKNLENNGVINKVIIADNCIYKINTTSEDTNLGNYIGKKVCTFKNEEVLLNITKEDYKDLNVAYILNKEIASYILTKILKVLNYRYGRTSKEDIAKPSANVRYF